jgi:MoaA/NifB/PqqE/SkfB family radical SAM enzyme
LVTGKEKELVGMNKEADKIIIATANAQKKQTDDLEKYNKLKADLELEIHASINTSEKIKDDIALLNDRIRKLSLNRDELAGEIPVLNSEILKLKNDKEIEAANVLKLRDEGLLLVKKHLYIEAKEKQLQKFADKAGVKI